MARRHMWALDNNVVHLKSWENIKNRKNEFDGTYIPLIYYKYGYVN